MIFVNTLHVFNFVVAIINSLFRLLEFDDSKKQKMNETAAMFKHFLQKVVANFTVIFSL